MAKDAKGHGSNTRGGSYPNIDKNLKGPGKHVGYANGPWQISKLGTGYLATHSQTGESFRGNSLGHVSDQLTARALHSGTPKSNAAPVHDSMAYNGYANAEEAKRMSLGASHGGLSLGDRYAAKMGQRTRLGKNR